MRKTKLADTKKPKVSSLVSKNQISTQYFSATAAAAAPTIKSPNRPTAATATSPRQSQVDYLYRAHVNKPYLSPMSSTAENTKSKSVLAQQSSQLPKNIPKNQSHNFPRPATHACLPAHRSQQSGGRCWEHAETDLKSPGVSPVPSIRIKQLTATKKLATKLATAKVPKVKSPRQATSALGSEQRPRTPNALMRPTQSTKQK